MSENEELMRLAAELTPFDLPVGVYVLARDGRFVNCNRRAREILRLPLEGDVDGVIDSFYRDPRGREGMHEELLRAEEAGRNLEQLVPFEVDGREIFVKEYSRSLRGHDSGLLGYVCCITDVTEGERSNRLLDALPAGVYKLDADDRCVRTNRAFARILGFESQESIRGTPLRDYYVNRNEDARVRRLVEERHPEPVTNFIAEFMRRDGQTIFVNVDAHMLEDEGGGYAGREGTVIDVTQQERYHRILRGVPVGLAIIRNDGRGDLIEDCNEQFLSLFDFPHSDPAQARGFDVRRLHVSEAEYARFRGELGEAAKQGRALFGYSVRIVTCAGEEKTVEVSSQPMVDPRGVVVGRTEALRDITQEAELRNRLDELTYDIGSVLHNYTTTLLLVQLSTEPLLQSLAPDPFAADREVTPAEAGEATARPAQRLSDALGHLLAVAKDDEGVRAPALPGERWARLGELQLMLRGSQDEIADDYRPVVLGEGALEIIKFCKPLLLSHKFSRESVAAVRDAAEDLLRITNLISLHQMREAVFEMDHQVRSLREFILTDTRVAGEMEVCRVRTLLSQARSNLDVYARSRHVNVRVELQEAEVRVVRREMLRALTNLLHNAIKYSWSRDKAKSPWVAIRTSVDGDVVHIEFKNWGVPIRREEIEQELIFKIGYRGSHSGDRGRIGTGIGLADARRVARAHRGELEVTSQPAVGSRDKEDYTGPFITTVVMTLPLHGGEGRRG